MKKILLSLAMALPILAFGQASPGGIGVPAIWLKGDVGLAGTDGQPVTGWTNQGTIPFTLTPGTYPAPTKQSNYATFGTDGLGQPQALVFDQAGTELSSVLGNGVLDLRYEVFIVATGYSSGALLYMGNNTPETKDGIMNNIGFGKRAVYYNSNTQASASDGDGESGYYNSGDNLKKRYAPNISDNASPDDLTISNTASNSYNPYFDLNSMSFSINGLADVKDPSGTSTNGQTIPYQGKLPTYGNSPNKYNQLNVQKILLGGVLKWDNTGIRRDFAGNYYEIIVYPRKLTTEERQKVLSYLAVKYNVYLIHDTGAYTGTATLGTSVGNGESVTNGTYFASDGSIIFKRDAYSYTDDKDYQGNAEIGFVKDTYYPLVTSNPNKNFQIFGRDDASGLSTTKTGNPSGAYFEKTSNQNPMPSDKSFAVLTSNVANFDTFSSTNDAVTPFPAGANILGRTARTWKLTTTGFNDGFQLTQGAGSFITANSLDMSNTVFLVSRDPNFEASKTAAVTPGYVSGFINLNKKLSDIVGSTSAGEYKVFYVTVAKTNGSPTGLITTLPVTFNSFAAKAKANNINVTWSTASEQNASHFIITRSTDGGNTFTEIGRVTASGNSNSTKNYSFVDQNPAIGVNYYQLQQVDNDGKISESGIVSAKISLATSELIVKEIASNSVTLAVSGTINGAGTITAVNTQGQVIANQSVNFNNGNTFTVKTGAVKGLIIFTLTTANGSLTKKIVK